MSQNDDLIDRRAAIEKLKDNLTYMMTFGADRSIDLINELPSAQPEIIRCRDCKFYTSMISGIGICDLACRHLGDDGFCSEAERREE